MGRQVIPIANLQRRLPEAGRIRFGVKTGKAMKAISTFRFTSHDEEALRQVAAIYGGDVAPWSDPKAAAGQFEVITKASEIQVALPPDPLGGTPVYELWGGGGCERRCDGLTAQVITKGPDGSEMTDVPCLCQSNGEMACEPRTRLSVILPEIRFGGVWRLETKSWNAAQELPGMVDLICSLQERGLTRGTLALKHRRSTVAGETHKFIVPVLGVAETVEALAAGDARVGAIARPAETAGELEAGEIVGGHGSAEDHDGTNGQGDQASDSVGEVVQPPETDTPGPRPADPDDDVVDAEIVEGTPPPSTTRREPPDTDTWEVADWKAAAKASGVTQASMMRTAREAAEAAGFDQPSGLDDLVKAPAELRRKVSAWLTEMEEPF